MKKLFALEDNTPDESNDLLIDKVLKKEELEKTPLNLTADILKQRQDLKEDIAKKLNEPPKTDEDSDTENNDADNANNEDSNQDNNQNNEGGSDSDSKTDDKGNSQSNNDDSDDSSAADNADSLNSIIGSGLSNKEDTNKEDSGNKEVSSESMKYLPKLSNIFNPLKNHYSNYRLSLESYSLSNKALTLEEQPITYVKESIIESLNNLVKIANNYIESNKEFIDSKVGTVKELNERITVFKQFIESKKYHFTDTLIKDEEILGTLSCPEKSDIRETIRILLNYIEQTNKANLLALKNNYESLVDSYANSGFKEDNGDYVYKDTLPGFNLIKVHVDPYKNYINTNVQNFQYYKLKVLKIDDLYSLNAITINDDKELNHISEAIDKLLVNISISTDNLNSINTHFNTFIESIKVISYDVEQNKYDNLANIDIDSKIKDFIKFKLIIENSYININMMIDYLTSVMSVLNKCVELKD